MGASSESPLSAREKLLAELRHEAPFAERDGYHVTADRMLRAATEIERLALALAEVADHPVVSEGEFPDDNCDWHCTATLVARAKDVLNG